MFPVLVNLHNFSMAVLQNEERAKRVDHRSKEKQGLFDVHDHNDHVYICLAKNGSKEPIEALTLF